MNIACSETCVYSYRQNGMPKSQKPKTRVDLRDIQRKSGRTNIVQVLHRYKEHEPKTGYQESVQGHKPNHPEQTYVENMPKEQNVTYPEHVRD